MICDEDLIAHNVFVARTREKWEFNQYWYSAHTIKVMIEEIEEISTKVAFLSTPSVYFSLKNGQLKERSFFFDVDTQWAGFPNYVRWDYNQPLAIDESFHHAFDCVVIDPPFVTHEVWAKYAETAQLLLTNGGKIILSTIRENAEILKRMLQFPIRKYLDIYRNPNKSGLKEARIPLAVNPAPSSGEIPANNLEQEIKHSNSHTECSD